MDGRFFFSGSMGILVTWERRGLLARVRVFKMVLRIQPRF
jgi:hypothetical protein